MSCGMYNLPEKGDDEMSPNLRIKQSNFDVLKLDAFMLLCLALIIPDQACYGNLGLALVEPSFATNATCCSVRFRRQIKPDRFI